MNTKKFRGRSIFEWEGYPAVYYPEHPEAAEGYGAVRIHRIIAHEKYGEIPEGFQVHHKDGDPWNWEPENLELVTKSEHGRIHNPPRTKKVQKRCKECNNFFTARITVIDERKYCSPSCSTNAKYNVDWPSKERLEEWVWEEPTTKIAEQLGVSGKAVEKRCNKLGIEKPGRGYWQKQ